MTELISIIILVVTIVLFITRPIPNAVTACLGCLLFAITGVCTLEDAFSGFSNSIVLLMFGMMVVGIAMKDTGVAKLIGHKVSDLSRHNERLFIFIAGLTSAVLSTFLSNTAVIAIFLPIIASISQTNPKMKRMNLTLPVTMCAMFGGVCTLVGSTPQLTANGILSEMCSMELGMFDYTIPGIIIFVVYMLYVQLVGIKTGEKIWGSRTETTEMIVDNTSNLEIPVNVDKKKFVFMLIIFAFIIVSFIGAWISASMTAIIAALLCIILGCTSHKSVIKHMDWSVVFILAGCLGIATGISKGGAGDLIGIAVSNVLHDGIPVILIFGLFVVATMIISNFITNSTAVIIILPIALAMCNAGNLNPVAFTLGIVFAANLAFSTPLANAQTAMTLVAGYKFSDYIKYTWLLDILILILIVVVIPLLHPLILA